MAEPSPVTDGRGGRLEGVRTAAALGLVALACFRAVVGFEPMPWWNSDPFESQVFTTGVTPALAAWLDAATVTLSGAGLAAGVLAGERVRAWLVGCGVLGTLVGVVWMVRVVSSNAIDTNRIAWAWIAAVWSAVALAHSCVEPRRRRLCAGLLLGVVGMLACKGAVQVLVEHADTVAWYERDPATFLRAHGWEPGSIQARGYERRLYQTEATGWFGLSNVYATVVSAAGVGLGAMAVVGGIERRRTRAIAALGIGSIAGVAALAMCGSKGGAVAAVAGAVVTVGVGVAARMFDRPRKPGAEGQAESRRGGAGSIGLCVAVAASVAPMLAVLARGLLGERLGELSLLFRWFYTQGAARVASQHWMMGVGPAGFRDEYLKVRPPLAVEDVVSPHSLAWDLLTSFGAFGGAAWYVLTVVLLAGGAAGWWAEGGRRDGARASRGEPESAGTPRRSGDDVKLVALLAIVATGAAASFERVLTTPETAAMRIVGVGLWVLVAWGVITVARLSRRAIIAGVFGASVVAMLHAGIEVTPTWVGAQTWFFALLGVAGGAAPEGARVILDRSTVVVSRRGTRVVLVAVSVAGASGLIACGPWRIVSWQRGLREAWVAASDVGRINDQIRVLEQDPALAAEFRVSPGSLRREVASLAGEAPATSAQEFSRQVAAIEERRARAAMERLVRAGPAEDIPTRRATDRAAQRLARVLVESGRVREAASLLVEREREATAAIQDGDSVMLRAHLGTLRGVLAEVYESGGQTERAREWRMWARDAHAAAAALDGRSVYHALRAARLSARIGEAAAASMWARRALENDANARLDPLMGLSDAEREEMGDLAGGIEGEIHDPE